jgi:hypothetical protein
MRQSDRSRARAFPGSAVAIPVRAYLDGGPPSRDDATRHEPQVARLARDLAGMYGERAVWEALIGFFQAQAGQAR